MWCVPGLNERYTANMEDVLAIYEKPYNPIELVVCAKKKTKPRGGAQPRTKACQCGSRLKRQHSVTLDQMIADLPIECNIGVKTSSKGHKQYWRGYKLHWDVVSGARIPVSCILTGANVHDSQVAIPLIEMSRANVQSDTRCARSSSR